MSTETQVALSFTVLGPALAFVLALFVSLVSGGRNERGMAFVVGAGFVASLLASALGVVLLATSGETALVVPMGRWFMVGEYHFEVRLVLDRLAMPFAIVNAVFGGLVGAFSVRYLHREPGYARFFVLLALFGAGMQLIVLAGGIDVLFLGWELVGLTSALLIAYFYEREKPVRHGLRAFVTYRITDMGLLAAAVWLHHSVGPGDIAVIAGEPFAGLIPPEESHHVLQVAIFLVVAAAGKAALVPLSGWLPRAMEGPTPSSAIFYGALSIHAGPYLLLRAAPLLERSLVAQAVIVGLGLATAVHATLAGRVQSDIKSALAYASLTQVGLIVMEIGLGLRFIALAHIVGHATMRTLQLLRAPSILQDFHHLEKAVGSHLPRTGVHFEKWVPAAVQRRLYRASLERGYFDEILIDRLIRPVMRALRAIDGLDVAWVRWLGGARAEKGGQR